MQVSLWRIPRGSAAEKPISTVEIESDLEILWEKQDEFLPISFAREYIYRFDGPLKIHRMRGDI